MAKIILLQRSGKIGIIQSTYANRVAELDICLFQARFLASVGDAIKSHEALEQGKRAVKEIEYFSQVHDGKKVWYNIAQRRYEAVASQIEQLIRQPQRGLN